MYKIKLINIWKHMKKVATHRYWVRRYCFMAGLYWQGLVHDLSKYSPTEFWESVQYYQGDRSPIDACKEKNGYSMAWFHHRGRNKHHWEYWVDDFQAGMIPKLMPEKYAIEMFCDFLAAGRAYMGSKYSKAAEFDWWKQKRKVVIMHPCIKEFMNTCFANYIIYQEKDIISKKKLHQLYEAAMSFTQRKESEKLQK